MARDNLYCFGGEDVTLIYYFRCRDCGTVILQDDSMDECLEPWECPTCDPTKNFPFRYFTREQLRENNRILGKVVGKRLTLLVL
jgi:hypothetical protein